MTSLVQKFLALRGWEKRAMALAWLSLPMFQVALRWFGLARVLSWVLNHPSPASMASDPSRFDLQGIRSLGTAVNRAATYPQLDRACLRRSLVLLWLLRRHGVAEAQLRLGVRFIGGILDAHAWVEWRGLPVNDRADIAATFTPMGDLAPLTAFHSA